MKAVVDSVIRLDPNYWPDAILDALKSQCHIPNADKEKMRREKVGGWQRLPDFISLWNYENYEVTIPRGLAHSLNSFAESYGHKIEWVDKRYTGGDVAQSWFDINHVVGLRDYQWEAVMKMTKAEQGYWKSPPGSGKTVAVLQMINSLSYPALVIVNTTNIAEQWRQRAKEYLNVEPGLVGDGSFDIKPLTIAMQQTLWAKRDELYEQKFFDWWGFVCLDECHHLPAETFTDILNRFSAKYRIGVSGTPTKQFEWKGLLEATLGPMIHETPKDELMKKGWLVKPSVVAKKTGFTHPFYSTHEHFGYKEGKKCFEPGCTRDVRKKRHQNNYQEVVSALIDDNARNQMIADQIIEDIIRGHCTLVLSKRLSHLKDIKDRVYIEMRTRSDEIDLFGLWMLTGEEDTPTRMQIAEMADKSKCAIFSTLADEALDIPRFDRVHLAFPGRNTDLIRQQIGRAERPHPDKDNVLVYDYIDNVGPLKNQYRERFRDVYVEEGLSVDERN